jgi:hypothetical protein
MKKSIIVITLFLWALTCFSRPRKVVLKTGQPVTVSKGDTVAFTLSANYKDGGYADSDAYDKTIFTALGKTAIRQEGERQDYTAQGGPIVIGPASEENTWRYIATRKGKGAITIYIYRPWEKEKSLKTEFIATVRVK